MRRRGNASIVANPVLVGAVTTLVVVVAVFLAYNANNGLPFVPTTQIKVQLANGSNLVSGNEVREGGYRIGVISEHQPIALSGKADERRQPRRASTSPRWARSSRSSSTRRPASSRSTRPSTCGRGPRSA